MADLQATIEELWERRDEVGPGHEEATAAVHDAIALLDRGEARVAEIGPDGTPVVHAWLKLAILLYFRISALETIELGPFEYADRIPLKTGFEAAGVRVVPGASARYGSFLDRGAVMMPSYVNIGARVGANTMVDTWATVGSCAQIGSNVHLSGGVGIGGVLEPPGAVPVASPGAVSLREGSGSGARSKPKTAATRATSSSGNTSMSRAMSAQPTAARPRTRDGQLGASLAWLGGLTVNAQFRRGCRLDVSGERT